MLWGKPTAPGECHRRWRSGLPDVLRRKSPSGRFSPYRNAAVLHSGKSAPAPRLPPAAAGETSEEQRNRKAPEHSIRLSESEGRWALPPAGCKSGRLPRGKSPAPGVSVPLGPSPPEVPAGTHPPGGLSPHLKAGGNRPSNTVVYTPLPWLLSILPWGKLNDIPIQ